jgi:hypothetical protein
MPSPREADAGPDGPDVRCSLRRLHSALRGTETLFRAAGSKGRTSAAWRPLQRGVFPERMVARGRLSVAAQPFGQGLAQNLAGRKTERLRS